MGAPTNDGKMEGWLYLIRSNRFGLQYSQKRYFVLQDDCLKSFKSVPVSGTEEPYRSAVIDSYIRVADNGRESIHRKVFFIFTLYNTVNQNDQLKLGASSPEDAARWIRSLVETTMKVCPDPARNFRDRCKRQCPSLRFRGSKRVDCKSSIDWTVYSSVQMEAMTSDVIAPSPWKIFGCRNGLRLFKESKDNDSHRRQWGDHPAIMAVGVVCGTSEEIFRTLMSLGPSRAEWDFCFFRGSLVEHLDGHTDIVHMQLYRDWLPWGMKKRDFLLRRYWRREDDGTYVVLYHSVFHMKFPPQKGYVRACLKSGGYVVTPINQGKHSLVKHMLAVDWKFWKLYLRPSSARAITIRMLERLAALRELFSAKVGDSSSEFSSSSRDLMNFELPPSVLAEIKTEIQSPEEMRKIKEAFSKENEVEKPRASLIGLNDAVDEFYDVPEPAELDHYENEWTPEVTLQQQSSNTSQTKLSTAAVFVKKLHDLAVQKKGYAEIPELAREEPVLSSYGSTLPKDTNCSSPCSWATSDPSLFLIRGQNYLKDNQKIKANGTLMQMVGADWLRSDRREDDLSRRPGGIVQKYAERGGPEFFFVVNIQVPGTTMYTLALYYMMRTPLESSPLLKSFVEGDDTFRNSRFKLIPYISQGSWIVKQSVGKKACLLGHALEVHYFRGNNYMEVEIDVGSSTVARGVVNLVLGYLNNLVIEMAFVIQGNTQEELPEILLGTCRLNHLDAAKSILVKP